MFTVLKIVFQCIRPVRFTIWPAIIGGASALGGAIVSGIQRRKAAKRANKRNIAMWKMQNEYNHPAKQMARFKEAGLNPNLIYGQGTPGNAQQMPMMQSAVGFTPEGVGSAMVKAYEILKNKHATKQQKELAKQEGIKTFIAEHTKLDSIRGIRLDNFLKGIGAEIELEKSEMWKQGINPSDNASFRFAIMAAYEAAKALGENWSQWSKAIIEKIDNMKFNVSKTLYQFIQNPNMPW